LGLDAVAEKFGVGPERVIDVQALAGDSVDNVPGVPGIGIKTAAQLIQEYGTLEALLERAEEIKQPKRRQSLIDHAEDARISKQLVTLRTDVPVENAVGDFQVEEPRAAELIGFLKGMEFNTLTKRIAERLGFDDVASIDAAVVAREGGVMPADEAPGAGASEAGGQPGAIAKLDQVKAPIDPSAYDTVLKLEDLRPWIEAAYAAGHLVIDTETTGLDAAQARLVGVSLSVHPGAACYIPLAHGRNGELGLEEAPQQAPLEGVIEALKPVLEDPAVLKIGQNLKYDCLILSRYGIDLHPIDDTMLLSYVIEGGGHGHGMDDLAERHLGHTCIAFKDIAGTGKAQKTFDQIDIDTATRYAAEDADVTGRLWHLLKPALVEKAGCTVYETLDRPMVGIVAGMEQEGVKIDTDVLSRMSHDFAQGMARLEAEAHEQAGEAFNLGSPKQVSEILFGKMGLPGGKKTKTGAWSTNADVLETLAAEGHELPKTLLGWRQISKLKSTYTDALPEFINPETGRVHTSYALAATTTGRLSSSDPNLQNIPIRTEEGRRIRTAFIAEKGNVLVSADYSQIELRVLADMADIPALKQAFADGLDIHAMTASEMFGVPIEGMDPMVRRRAKAINFGIIYGISAFGLANQLSIPQREAADYIKAYFDRFPQIKDYMDRTKTFGKENGYVETLFGRRCTVAEIKSKVPARRAFAERQAINAPIQGTAADIIRRAMIRLPKALGEAGLAGKMLLQVHDELVFETPKAEAKALSGVVKTVMETAAEPARALAVPLVVEANAGANWDEAH
ncbi:MAG: DNA polymerase I, partial [Pseudomonadota bacterium]